MMTERERALKQTPDDPGRYEPPRVIDLGDLREITGASKIPGNKEAVPGVPPMS
jgi:hypothetical protein